MSGDKRLMKKRLFLLDIDGTVCIGQRLIGAPENFWKPFGIWGDSLYL